MTMHTELGPYGHRIVYDIKETKTYQTLVCLAIAVVFVVLAFAYHKVPKVTMGDVRVKLEQYCKDQAHERAQLSWTDAGDGSHSLIARCSK